MTPLYENLGKSISPRSASLVLLDIVGAGNIEFNFAEAEYEDYEDFNYNEGYYPGKQDSNRVGVCNVIMNIMTLFYHAEEIVLGQSMVF